MRRKLFTLLLLCLCMAARGQSMYEYRYWFDGNEDDAKTGGSDNRAWRMDLDIGHLDASLHTVFFQLKDAKGVWSVPKVRYFVKLAEKQAERVEYWFDNGSKKKETLASSGMADIDVSQLADGMHIVHVQVSGSTASASSPRTAVFWKQAILAKSRYRLWFDNDNTNTLTGQYTGQPISIDVSHLADGFHILHAQVENASPSQPQTSMFIKVPQTQGVDYMACSFMVDGEMYRQEQVPTHGGIVNWTLDATGMKPGLHKAQAFVVTPSGAATGLKETFFYRAMTDMERMNMKCLYSVDGDEHYTEAGTLNGNLYHFDLDMASLTDGFHSLSYMLMGEDGTSSKVMSSFFVKTPLGGNGIMQYDYWLNDDEANRTMTKLGKRTDPLKLITLLPVESRPIRSSCFQFEVGKDGKPMMYARNDLHMRFYDVAGRLTETSRQFVDYKVSEEVNDVRAITGVEGSVNAEKPTENNVVWYSISATVGDSIAVRSSQASTLQVFSPSGKEMYSATGSESVEYGGCHASENGTYYVALHDVMGTNGNTVNLDYLHLDKYDVIGQDVKVVGNGGYSTITFRGNGFHDLVSVTLKGASTIVADDMDNSNDAEVAIKFDFCNAETGMYNALFKFKEGDKLVENCITVEKAKPITIAKSMAFATAYLRNTSNTYTLTLKNNGNMTAYEVPIPLCVYTEKLENLKKVDIKGFDLYSMYKKVLPQLFTKEYEDKVAEEKKEVGDMCMFTHSVDNDYVAGYPALHKTVMSVDLPPNVSKTIKIAIKADATAYLYVWCPEEWNSQSSGKSSKVIRKSAVDGLCALGKADACERNQYCIDNGIDPRYDVDCTDVKPNKNCPPPDGGSSNPVNSLDPNDIYGYVAESGSKFMTNDVQKVNYRIEFENDQEFATASAHVVKVTDELDAQYFDLSSYAPTSVKIGDKTIDLDGSPRFVKTVDMRPAINAIVQVEGMYDNSKGVATWLFTSLDPMTMEPTDNVMQGFLPVNNDGVSGIGEVAFDIKLNRSFDDGTEISNKALIVFDSNDPIETPVWTNIVDAVAPESEITFVAMQDNVVTLRFDANDNRSGVWKYLLYVQDTEDGNWTKVEDEITKPEYKFKGYSGFDYGFCVRAVDMAGNVEQKELKREISQATFKYGDANGDEKVNSDDITLAVQYYTTGKAALNFAATDMDKDGVINSNDIVEIVKVYTSSVGKPKSKVRKRIRRINK